MALSLAWLLQLRSVLDFVRTDLRTVRLAIAKGDRSDRVMHPSQVAGHDDPPYARHGNEDDGARLGRGRVSGNRLQHSVGRWVEKDRGGVAGEKVRAVRDRSALPRKKERASLEGTL